MRLDSLGKPPMVQSYNVDKTEAEKITVEEPAAVENDSGSESYSREDTRGRLGKILSLLENARDKKKKSKGTKHKRDLLQAYREMAQVGARKENLKGGALDIKV